MGKVKALSYEELIDLAEKNYNKGGDAIVECWDRGTYDYYVREFRPITMAVAREMFRMRRAELKEYAATCW